MTLNDMNIVCAFYRSIVCEQRLLAALRQLERSLHMTHAMETSSVLREAAEAR